MSGKFDRPDMVPRDVRDEFMRPGSTGGPWRQLVVVAVMGVVFVVALAIAIALKR